MSAPWTPNLELVAEMVGTTAWPEGAGEAHMNQESDLWKAQSKQPHISGRQRAGVGTDTLKDRLHGEDRSTHQCSHASPVRLSVGPPSERVCLCGFEGSCIWTSR